MMAGRRVRHAVEFGALTGLQVALVGPAGLPVVVAAVAAAFGLAAAVGRWRSRTTLAGLAAAALVATAVVGVAVGTGGVAPMALVGSTTPAAGWRGVVVALASVPEGHVLYGDTGLLPTGARFAFPGVVALGLAAWGWQHARALGCAPLALSAASVAVASLAAMACGCRRRPSGRRSPAACSGSRRCRVSAPRPSSVPRGSAAARGSPGSPSRSASRSKPGGSSPEGPQSA